MNPLSDIPLFLSFAVYQLQRQCSVTQLQKALNGIFKSNKVYFLKQLNFRDLSPQKLREFQRFNQMKIFIL